MKEFLLVVLVLLNHNFVLCSEDARHLGTFPQTLAAQRFFNPQSKLQLALKDLEALRKTTKDILPTGKQIFLSLEELRKLPSPDGQMKEESKNEEEINIDKFKILYKKAEAVSQHLKSFEICDKNDIECMKNSVKKIFENNPRYFDEDFLDLRDHILSFRQEKGVAVFENSYKNMTNRDFFRVFYCTGGRLGGAVGAGLIAVEFFVPALIPGNLIGLAGAAYGLMFGGGAALAAFNCDDPFFPTKNC